jgi:phosphoglycerate dehydrogenase-like enzyme
LTEHLNHDCADWLGRHAQVVWCPLDRPEELASHLKNADAVVIRSYTQVNAQFLDQAPKLKVVGRAGVGLDNIDLVECKNRGVLVVYTPEANSQAVVEYIFGLMLDALRPRKDFDAAMVPEMFAQARKDLVGVQLETLTLGILGFGRIGKRVGQVAHAIGMNIVVNDLLSEVHLRKEVDYAFEFVDKPDLYAKSDVLTIHVDGRDENRQLIDAQVLDQLRPSCLLINAARGPIIDIPALAAWAAKVADAGGRAVIDVHDPEPPPTDYPLFGLDNVRLLPHLAARTETALKNMSWVVRDVAKVLQGNRPNWPAY